MLIRKVTGIYCKTHMEINKLFGILHAYLNVKTCGSIDTTRLLNVKMIMMMMMMNLTFM